MNRKMTDYIAVITEEQRRELLRYLEDRRGSYNAKVVVCGVALLVTTLLSLPVYLGYVDSRTVSYRPKGKLTSVELAYFPPVLLIIFICLLIRGFGRYFGPTSPISCVRRCDYSCARILVGSKAPDTGRHPYYINGMDGVRYCCPVYLDYKYANAGGTMIGVVTSHGRCYAMADSTAAHEADASVQRRLPPGI